MNDNELRDRIAKAIMNPLTDGMRYVDGPDDGSGVIQVDGFVDPREIVQAVIDDLGLQWEQRLRTWDDMDGESRVVGKWEEA